MSIVDGLKRFVNAVFGEAPDDEVEENRRAVVEALLDTQRERVRWLRNLSRYGSSPEQREDAERKLEEELETLRRLERGELEEFHKALGV